MKFSRLLALLLLLPLLAACAPSQPEDTRLKVVTTFYPMYDFACKIGGDKVKVTNLVPPGAEPHDWEPTAADIAAVNDCDVFVYCDGVDSEWAKKILSSLNEDIVVARASDGILIDIPGDYHFWLSPQHAVHQFGTIRDALRAADNANAEYYRTNCDQFIDQLFTLDEEYKTALQPFTGETIVVAHESFGYLCQAYGLEQAAIEGLSPDSEPDPARVAEIIDLVRSKNISTIFFEELVSPRVAETIARETGAKTALLNPLEGLTEEQLKAGEDYFSIMRENLATLVTSF